MSGEHSPDNTASKPVSVATAREQLLASVAPRSVENERVALSDAADRILGQDVISSIAVPGWDNSAMDGYAVNTADLDASGETRLPISQYIPAGTAPEPLKSGTAARIFTGAPIPQNADAVVMQENCSVAGNEVSIQQNPPPGNNIRPAGEDIRQGESILPAGRRLRPQDIGLAASVGVAAVEVRKPLRVALLTTGDELVAPGSSLGPGQIYDSNGPLLHALLQRMGCCVMNPGRVADTRKATTQALARAANDADLIVTSGGVSVGEEDHVKAAIQELGSLDLWKIAVKPGKPLAFGRVNGTALVGLPGNPVSLFVTFLLFAAPVIRRKQGREWTFPEAVPTKAGFARPRPGGREEYLRVRMHDGRLEPFPKQGSGVLSSAAWADGLARIPANTPVAEGDTLDYLSLGRLME